jgi:2-polyprenyl-6-methoxyphenol hydroxylase-like FAD-dependent oxidoreductase
VIGAGICGIGTALLLARDGHEVTVLEKDPQPEPQSLADCWERWARKGVAQFRQPHNFMPGLRLLLEADLADVQDALIAAGSVRFDMLNPMPPWMSGGPQQPIDEQLWTWTCRRPTGEWVFLRAAQAQKGIDIRRGVAVAGLVTGAEAQAGTPHVVGVRTSEGEEIAADLVVDASGRGSRSPQWLEAIGAGRPQEEDAGVDFTYFTRYFRGTPPERVAPLLSEFGTISILTLPGDGDTWSLTIFASSSDRPLAGLRNTGSWMAVIGACPLHTHWTDGEPISDVLTMGGALDRYRRLARDGDPIVTGFVGVADAWACTNPSAGRGMTIGLLHGRLLRDCLRHSGADPARLAKDFDERTERELRPWYDAQIASDRLRFATIEAHRAGMPAPPPSSPLEREIRLLRLGMMANGDMFRAGLEYIATLSTVQEIMERAGMRQRMEAAVNDLQKSPRPPIPGPTREQLVALVTGA